MPPYIVIIISSESYTSSLKELFKKTRSLFKNFSQWWSPTNLNRNRWQLGVYSQILPDMSEDGVSLKSGPDNVT